MPRDPKESIKELLKTFRQTYMTKEDREKTRKHLENVYGKGVEEE